MTAESSPVGALVLMHVDENFLEDTHRRRLPDGLGAPAALEIKSRVGPKCRAVRAEAIGYGTKCEDVKDG
jgi:hypothetical protein